METMQMKAEAKLKDHLEFLKTKCVTKDNKEIEKIEKALEQLQEQYQKEKDINVEQDDFFAVIRWSKADIMSKLEEKGYAPTLENADYLIQNHFLKRTLQDQSIAAGWDIIEDCIPFNDDGLKLL